MKASGFFSPPKLIVPDASEAASVARRSFWPVSSVRLLDYLELAKPRINLLVLLVTGAGFFMGAGANLDLVLLFHCLIGTAMLGAGSSALNHLFEKQYDAIMTRTAGRPLPAGRMHPLEALAFGLILGAAGLSHLLAFAGFYPAVLGFFTFTSYAFIYTPLKRWSWLSLYAGAVPGALPPLIGWSAASRSLPLAAWAVFGIIFFWQIPHFYSIAWIYRDDYRLAGFAIARMLDSGKLSLARQVFWTSLLLLAASLLPAFLGLTGKLYLCGALLLGAGFMACASRFARWKTAGRARQLLYASLVYLPALFLLLTLDKT